jgi:hypothetical protein
MKFFQMHHGRYLTRPDRDLDHMPDGIVGSVQMKPVDQLSNQLQQLSIQQTMTSQTTGSAAPPTQTSDVHSVQSTNLKATQQPDGKKKQ